LRRKINKFSLAWST